jgi:hypothetical protein
LADVKISGLPASTVPLAGTEVLPIVQGGATKQVSIANVTAGRAVSALSVTTDTNKAASSAGGALQANNGTVCLQWGAGGGSGLIFDGGVSSTAANAAIVFSPTGTGTVAISPAGALTVNPTTASTINNVSIGVTTAAAGGFTTVKAATTIGVGAATPSSSGAGITFPATQSASTDVNTLDDYEEGTWTPTDNSGAGLTLTVNYAKYVKIGKSVTVAGYVTYPATADVAVVSLAGFPFAFENFQYIGVESGSATPVQYFECNSGFTNAVMRGPGSVNILNSNLSSNYIIFTGAYISQ